MNYPAQFDSHAGPRLRRLFSAIFTVAFSLWIAGHVPAWGREANPGNLPVVPVETNTPELRVTEPGTSVTNPVSEVVDTATPASADLADTNSPALAPEPGMLPTPDVVAVVTNKPLDHSREFQTQLDLARQQRRDKNPSLAVTTLVALLQTNASAELKRPVLFELALAAQDDNQLLKAQQVFSQYLHNYPEDPSVPEVLLRQGLLYRQMGVTSLAISKFYAVMSSALKLKLNNIDYYKKLVLQAQVEELRRQRWDLKRCAEWNIGEIGFHATGGRAVVLSFASDRECRKTGIARVRLYSEAWDRPIQVERRGDRPLSQGLLP